MKDPQVYLRRLGIKLSCPIHPEKRAFIDKDFRSMVNHEIYFFSSREAREQFDKQPLQYCGLLTDPVRGIRFEPTHRSPRADYAGRPYFFASEESKKVFLGDPTRYANAKRVMMMPPAKDEPKKEPAPSHD